MRDEDFGFEIPPAFNQQPVIPGWLVCACVGGLGAALVMIYMVAFR